MSTDSDYTAYPVFKGARRVPTIARVPTTAAMGAFAFIACLTVIFSLFCIVLVVPAYVVLRLITANDDRFFRKVGLWIVTKRLNKNLRFWKASSYGVGPRRRGWK